MLQIATYNFKAILEGCLSLVPGGKRLFRRGTRGSESARYCYSVWLRHVVRTQMYRKVPLDGVVVELGPGDSLGMGLAALLSGARQYIAVDVVSHASAIHNLAVFDELVRLFSERAAIPDGQEFPLIKPDLDDYAFPEEILDQQCLARSLAAERLAAIRASLLGEGPEVGEPLVRYVDPNTAEALIEANSVDWVFSQAVLEHVDDLIGTYGACHAWLKPGAITSHDVDFKSHGTSRVWNGHWAYPDLVWRLLRGRRPYLLNREPCAVHLQGMADAGFEILSVERVRKPSQLRRAQLARRFRSIGDDDLTTASAFVVARKPAGDKLGH
ncbi:methyltransferase domain-containing protein [Stagnimonas aquatica]|uniref:Methyltransferase domain-containing protein n=1 Tax=Stagnimonas aquatica TaxID=2689987 RepID=A0A3N0VKV2_9GAMM|nr:methyltransferase domain-containing protein [Stagnimonas aquatica]ROH93399.1 methyltransferase domain-containing protein [Stagnimonas aquatica]